MSDKKQNGENAGKENVSEVRTVEEKTGLRKNARQKTWQRKNGQRSWRRRSLRQNFSYIKSSEEKLTVEKTCAEKLVDEKSSYEKSNEEKPLDKELSEDRTVEDKSAEEKSSEEKPLEEKLTEEEAQEKKEKKKKRKKRILFAAAAVLVAVLASAFTLYENSLVYKECSVEAGVEVEASDLLTGSDPEAYIVGYEDGFDTSVPGEYELKVKTGLFEHDVLLSVHDTIAPELELQDIVIEYKEEIYARDFVTHMADATEVTLSFVTAPDNEVCGDQTVEICAVDLGGNKTVKETELTVWPIKTELTVEAGEEFPDVTEFLLDEDISGASYVTDVSAIEMNHTGSYKLKIAIGKERYDVELTVSDTKAPVFTVHNIEGYSVLQRPASSFVTNCEDETDVTFTYAATPNFNQLGQQSVTIIATDEGGNTVSADAVLTLNEDTEPPVIIGATDRAVYLGKTVAYRSFVSASDNCPEGLSLYIDSSAVNLNAEGTYPVICTASDAAGNTVTASFNITVMVRTYSESEVYAMADSILASICPAGMSNYDKAYAIFSYVKSHVSYRSGNDYSNWIREAGETMVDGTGDCFSYTSLSAALLTRAGITNMIIQKLPSLGIHFWNLVDIGDGHGWYHFDTTPRLNGNPQIFLWTDAQMMQYSAANGSCFEYDRSVYPVIP